MSTAELSGIPAWPAEETSAKIQRAHEIAAEVVESLGLSEASAYFTIHQVREAARLAAETAIGTVELPDDKHPAIIEIVE